MITVERNEDNIPTIKLEERFDFESVAAFRSSYEGIKLDGVKHIIVDFRNTRFIDSSSLGMLINARNFFEKHEVDIVLLNANDHVKRVFSISRFDKKFVIK